MSPPTSVSHVALDLSSSPSPKQFGVPSRPPAGHAAAIPISNGGIAKHAGRRPKDLAYALEKLYEHKVAILTLSEALRAHKTAIKGQQKAISDLSGGTATLAFGFMNDLRTTAAELRKTVNELMEKNALLSNQLYKVGATTGR